MTKEEIFEKVLVLRDEFNECSLHLHLRGLQDVREKAILLLNEALRTGYTARDFRRFLSERSIKLSEEEVFLRSVVKYMKKVKL
jgi:hypothetical protein